ncbi:MAG TPA: (Fe-S)-binding protein [Anaerolineae bacterium]|nr:(Fe-S)-binding protein [Anaerolineae bacterium]
MYRPYTRAPFDSACCTGCGECFHQCPVMRLPLPEARAEIERLRAMDQGSGAMDGDPSSIVLRNCTSCLACNQVCPEECRPANLVLDLWHAAYLREGLPARAAWFLPHARPNFRTYILDRLPGDERQAVARWRQGGPAREFLYAGCNLVTTPYLTFSRLFEGLEIRGGLDYCCGEMLFRMGLYEAVEQVARRLTLWFGQLGAERVYLVCTAGLNLLRNVLPQFGADFGGIEFLPFQQILLERLRSEGYWGLSRKHETCHAERGDAPCSTAFRAHAEIPRSLRSLGMTAPEQPSARPPYRSVTVQDSCHARTVAPGFCDLPRQVLEACGVEVREAPGHGDTQLCCGIGGGFAHASAYDPFRLLLAARRTSREHRQMPADATCVYCSGCLEMMSSARFVDPSRRPVVHLLEIVQWAMGETPRRRQGTLARQFLAGALRNQFPSLMSRERFWLPDIPPEPDPAEAR